jgi:tRNA(adenine34) deaminase
MTKRPSRLLLVFFLAAPLLAASRGLLAQANRVQVPPTEVARIEAELDAFSPHPGTPDDGFAVICLREAIAGIREGSGGVGACLVREATGEVVERGHNRQFSPHFRTDMHAEMDLLDKYEDRMRILKPSPGEPGDPRRMYEGLALYTSMEPCPMCMTRILNTRVKRVLSVALDPLGAMTAQVALLPPFWREMSGSTAFSTARCNALLTEMAKILFGSYVNRGYKGPPAPDAAR